jgi:hypothetical protein
LFAGPGPAKAQNEPGRGWVEGVIVTDEDIPAARQIFGSGVADEARITIRPKKGNAIVAESDFQKGGFYTFRNLMPGTYEVFVDRSFALIKGEEVVYRPQHIFGLVVEPDKRTVLNITVHAGKELEEVGKPDVTSEHAIFLAEELARLQKEIEELRKQIEELKKDTPRPPRKPIYD